MPTLFDSQRLNLLSPLSPVDCVSRITAAINIPRSSLPYAERFNSNQVIGRVTASSLRLRIRIEYRNSFQSVLVAKLRPEAAGTAIAGTIGMHLFVRTFMCFWLSGVLLIGGVIFFAAARDLLFGAPVHGAKWIGIFFPLVMLAFGFCLLRFGRRLANTESDFLVAFLIKTLNASPRGTSDLYNKGLPTAAVTSSERA